MMGRYGAMAGGWYNPFTLAAGATRAAVSAGSSVSDWWYGDESLPEAGVSDQDYTPTQQITSPEIEVPRRVERPSQPQQSNVPGVTAQQMRQDPYQTVVQFPTAHRSSGWPTWAPWAIGAGVFALLVLSATGAVAVRRKRRRRR